MELTFGRAPSYSLVSSVAADKEKNVKAAFETYNKLGDGVLSIDEMQTLLTSIGMDAADMDDIFPTSAGTGGCISMSEFLNWIYASDETAASQARNVINESAEHSWTGRCGAVNHPVAEECRICGTKIPGIERARIELAQLKITKEEREEVLKACGGSTNDSHQPEALSWNQQVQKARRLSWQQMANFSPTELKAIQTSAGEKFDDMSDGVKIELARTIVPHMRYLASLSQKEIGVVIAEADREGNDSFQSMSWAARACFASKVLQQYHCLLALTESQDEFEAVQDAAGESFDSMSMAERVELARTIVPNMRYWSALPESLQDAIEQEAEFKQVGSFKRMSLSERADFGRSYIQSVL